MEITSAQALILMERAISKAIGIDVNANIAIIDTAGHMKLFHRMDNAFLGSIDIAIQKAKTAMLFRMNSEMVGEFLAPENKTYGLGGTNGGLVAFPGGMPVKTEEVIIAYIGVSGGSPDQDFEIASAGNHV
jgi:uncharacterized protein GlcG (DUF336 family)